MKESKIIKGRLKGKIIKIDSTIKVDDSLPFLASQGNWAAVNAIELDNYTIADAPFVYGHIDSLGYIVSKKQLED